MLTDVGRDQKAIKNNGTTVHFGVIIVVLAGVAWVTGTDCSNQESGPGDCDRAAANAHDRHFRTAARHQPDVLAAPRTGPLFTRRLVPGLGR